MIKRLLAIALLGVTSVHAQTVTGTTATVQTTPNLITSGTNHTWTGATTGTLPANYMPGGSAPIYDPGTNTITFSYANATVAQTIAINNALANVGAGIKVNGYNYSYDVRNMNGDDRQPGVDNFSVATKMTSNTGATLLSSQENYSTKFDWTSVSGSRTTTTPYDLANLGSLQFKVVGMDSGYWGGYFGPQLRNANMSLAYTVDPCAANPAFSTTCANYSTNILTSGNMFTGTTGTQLVAINQALALSGSGVMIHGFNYGYNYNVGGTQCTATNQDGSCSWWMNSTASVVTTIKDSANATIYSQSENYTGPTSGSKNVNYLFPTSRNLSSLGTFKMAVGTSGNASVTGMYSNAIYTPDWCAQNPLYSSTCPGYSDVLSSDIITAQSYAINSALNLVGAGVKINGFQYGYDYYVGGDWCRSSFLGICLNMDPSSMAVDVNVTSSTGASLYSRTHNHTTQNAGGSPSYSYVFPSQLPISAMGNFSLSTREVGSTALYSSWSRWQYTPDPCTVNPLSSSSCPGYQQAYTAQQCTYSALYDSSCPGYAQALFTQQCNANQLSNQSCPGYAAAYLDQQCSLDPLYSTTCSGYTVAYHDQQCSLSPLYATDCTGYSTAYHDQQCSLNGTYATDCTNYDTAYKAQQCTANPLYATDCPGYAQAYLNQQCLADSLYSNRCEGYKTAYAIKYLVGLDSSVTSAVNQQLTNTVEIQRNDPTNVTGTVDAFSTATGGTTSSTTASATTSAASVSPVAIISTIKPAPPAPTATMAQAEPKKEDKKEEGKKDGNSNTGNSSSSDSKPSDQPKSNREALQERRREAAQKEAVAKGKDLANEMGKAADMEAQKAVQNVVIQAMGFTPGFDTYNKSQLPDANVFYKPYQVYGGQTNVDNRNVSRRLMGGSDVKHQEMIDSQFQLGK